MTKKQKIYSILVVTVTTVTVLLVTYFNMSPTEPTVVPTAQTPVTNETNKSTEPTTNSNTTTEPTTPSNEKSEPTISLKLVKEPFYLKAPIMSNNGQIGSRPGSTYGTYYDGEIYAKVYKYSYKGGVLDAHFSIMNSSSKTVTLSSGDILCVDGTLTNFKSLTIAPNETKDVNLVFKVNSKIADVRIRGFQYYFKDLEGKEEVTDTKPVVKKDTHTPGSTTTGKNVGTDMKNFIIGDGNIKMALKDVTVLEKLDASYDIDGYFGSAKIVAANTTTKDIVIKADNVHTLIKTMNEKVYRYSVSSLDKSFKDIVLPVGKVVTIDIPIIISDDVVLDSVVFKTDDNMLGFVSVSQLAH